MTILMRMLGLNDGAYERRKEPGVAAAMRKVTGSWDEEEEDDHSVATTTNVAANEKMQHDVFLNRIRRTLYVGGSVSNMSNHSTNSQAISRPLAEYAAGYFSESHRGHSLNRLCPVFVTQLDSTPCTLILAMIYLDRLQEMDPTYARKITPTELFLVSMLVSTKFYYGYDENTPDAIDYSNHADIPLELMHQLEIEFLCAIDWNLNVSQDEFFAKLCIVEYDLALRQGCSRGWLTYTEMAQLFPSINIAKALFKYSAVFALSYTASVFTIAGAFLLASQVPGTSLYRPASDCDSTSMPSANTTTLPDLPHNSSDAHRPDTSCQVDLDGAPDSQPQRQPFQLPHLLDAEIPPNTTNPRLNDSVQHIFDLYAHHLQALRCNHTAPSSDTHDSAAPSSWHDEFAVDLFDSCQAASSYGPLLTWMQFM